MSELFYQIKFVEILKSVVPANVSLAAELSSLLNISADSAYRRLRGETDLTMNEAVKLCHHFDVPLEALNNEMQGVVTFKFSPFLEDSNSFHNYLKAMRDDLIKISGFEDKTIYFAAEDIPVFHHFADEKLASFKLFYWMKSILGLEELQGKHFNFSFTGKAMLKTAAEIYKKYSELSSVEIWTEETAVSTLKQIRFYWDAGFFETNTLAFDIINALEGVLRNIQRQAETGHKFNQEGSMTKHKFTLYASDLMIGNNCVLVKADGSQFTYISYNSFNSMHTSNKFFNTQSERWMDNLISKSTLLSNVAEKQRNVFFKGIYKTISDLKLYIENNA